MFFNLIAIILTFYLTTKVAQRIFRKGNNHSETISQSQKTKTTIEKRKCAVSLCEELNSLVVSANKSNDYEFRLKNVKLAYIKLAELKLIAAEDANLKLTDLDEFSNSIRIVEKETTALSTRNKSIPNSESSDQIEETYQSMVTNLFRIINESILLVQKSKNIETQISRLVIAKLKISALRNLSKDLGIYISGIEEATDEILRLESALKNGLPTIVEGMPQIDIVDTYDSKARRLIKEATALKKEKKLDLACQKLEEAYFADGAEQLTIEERLRLPMYLQLAGKDKEGWNELDRLSKLFAHDGYFTSSIEKQKRIFIKKQKTSLNTAISSANFGLNKNSTLEGYCWFNTTSDEEIESDEFWEKFSANVRQGEFWVHEIHRHKNEPYQRLKIALFNLPLPAAFKESAIALRLLIKEKRAKKESFDAELCFLYWLAAVDSFVLPCCKTISMPGFNVIQIIPALKLKKLDFTYQELGYENLTLLNKTDCKWLQEIWGPPITHITLNDLHSDLWDAYEKKTVDKIR